MPAQTRTTVLPAPAAWSLLLMLLAARWVAAAAPAVPALPTLPAEAPAGASQPLMQIGAGDTLTLQVFGQPDMTGAVYVADDGTVSVPLVGAVQVASLSPAQAAARIEEALRKGNVLVDPHVTVTMTQTRSQRVSVLGEVGLPGRYPIDTGTLPLDLLAQAGGVRETGSDTAYVIRRQDDGQVQRLPVDLAPLASGVPTAMPVLRPGDVLFVPLAEEYFVSGEVVAPAKYRFRRNLTVVEAIARAGGVTPRGSNSRFEIRRHLPDGSYHTFSPRASDLVQPDDILRVKERLF